MTELSKKQNKTPAEVYDLIVQTSQPGADNKEVMEIYKSWAEQYDKDTVSTDYNPPDMLANEVGSFYGDNKQINILDAAAGTGRVGKALYGRGFKRLDAIDGSSEMLEVAKKLNIYTNFYAELLGPNKLSIDDDTYDLIATTGSFCPGHVKEDCFEELLRITKTGGHIMIIISMFHYMNGDYGEKVEARILELEKEGLWKVVTREIKERYYKDRQGVLFMLQKS